MIHNGHTWIPLLRGADADGDLYQGSNTVTIEATIHTAVKYVYIAERQHNPKWKTLHTNSLAMVGLLVINVNTGVNEEIL